MANTELQMRPIVAIEIQERNSFGPRVNSGLDIKREPT